MNFCRLGAISDPTLICFADGTVVQPSDRCRTDPAIVFVVLQHSNRTFLICFGGASFLVVFFRAGRGRPPFDKIASTVRKAHR